MKISLIRNTLVTLRGVLSIKQILKNWKENLVNYRTVCWNIQYKNISWNFNSLVNIVSRFIVLRPVYVHLTTPCRCLFYGVFYYILMGSERNTITIITEVYFVLFGYAGTLSILLPLKGLERIPTIFMTLTT